MLLFKLKYLKFDSGYQKYYRLKIRNSHNLLKKYYKIVLPIIVVSLGLKIVHDLFDKKKISSSLLCI